MVELHGDDQGQRILAKGGAKGTGKFPCRSIHPSRFRMVADMVRSKNTPAALEFANDQNRVDS